MLRTLLQPLGPVARVLHRGGLLSAGRRAARLGLGCLMLWSGLAAPRAMAQFPDFGDFDGPGGFGGFGGGGGEVSLSAELVAAEGDRPPLLFVTAQIAEGFHVYAVDQQKLVDGGGPQATKLAITLPPGVKQLGPFQALTAPKTHLDTIIWEGLELREHEGQVTWVAPLAIDEGVPISELEIAGSFEGQACNPQTCIPIESEFSAVEGAGQPLPPGFTLSLTSTPSATSPADSAPGTSSTAPAAPKSRAAATPFSPELPTGLDSSSRGEQAAPRPAASATVYDIHRIELTPVPGESLTYYLLTAFLGGIILNVMPCVLPVIGLKIMSFVQQAGESRSHAWALNLWYSLGIVSVFLGLATLAVFLQMGWGDQFASAQFNIVLVGVVFAMALSLMGVWEIPIPGFVGSGAAVEMAEREGPSAAFLKGVLTTVLATPCTGPFMATALAWSVRQPTWTTYSVFGALGAGMASPYLLIGAFPGLIRFLPKPGMWMETFKQVMGVVLLATVVWLLSFLDAPLVVPTVALLVGITGICGWLARTPLTAPASQRLAAWSTALLLTAIAAIGCYGFLYERVMLPRHQQELAAHARAEKAEDRIRIAEHLRTLAAQGETQQFADRLIAEAWSTGQRQWQPFTLEQLGRLTLDERKTVLVDFTADWCATCKTLEKIVLKTDEVQSSIAANEVVTMVADYTDKPDWMRETIRALHGNGVPVIAIFPADRPYHPIVFLGGYTKASLIEAIEKATRPGKAPNAAPDPGALARVPTP